MPLIDIPLEKLKLYQGLSPRPNDIDEFWDDALDEMRSIDPQIEMTESDFISPVARCYDMYFTGIGGSRIYAKVLKPINIKGRMPAVINFHGYGGSSSDWSTYLSYVGAGFVVAALDCRGQGGKSRDDCGGGINTFKGQIIRGLNDGRDNLLFKSIFLDTAQLSCIIMDMDDVDETRGACKGGSQGGGLTLACASLVPEMKLALPQFPFLSDYKRVWEMDLDLRAYAELRDFFRHYDPQHKHHDEIFDTLSYIDIQNITHRIKAKVLMFTGLMDEVCPPSTQFAAFNKINSEKDVVIYPDFGHENLPGSEDIAYEFITQNI